MKKLGLVGGMGAESTLVYYHDIVYGVYEKMDKKIFPSIVIDSVNLLDVLIFAEKDKQKLIELMVESIENLVSAGAEIIAMTSNTSHLVYEEVKVKVSVPMVSILETTCNQALQCGYHKIGLLGTIFTMESECFQQPFQQAGIQIVTPDQTIKEYVNDKIIYELEQGIVKPETQKRFIKIIEKMKKDQGIEAVVLGCTELPLLFKGVSTPVECLDTMAIHIKTLINSIIDEDKI